MGRCLQLLQRGNSAFRPDTFADEMNGDDTRESITATLGFISLNLKGEKGLAALKAARDSFILVDNYSK